MDLKLIIIAAAALLILFLLWKFNFFSFFKKDKVIEKFEDDNKCLKPPEKIIEKFENNKNNVFLEFSTFDDENNPKTENYLGRIEVKLYDDIVPITCENFRSLAKVEYKNTIVHRLIPGFMVQMGDYEHGDGTGGKSIYGEHFDDENFIMKHSKRGILSMANSGKNTNGSQFFITFKETPHLDDKHVVFGEIIKGFDVLDKIEKLETDDKDQPIKLLVLRNSGIC